MPVSDAPRARAATEGFTARMAAMIVRLRWVWLALTVALTAFSLARIDQIWPLDPDARVFFAEENPDLKALDAFEAAFNKDDSLAILLTPGDGAVFTPRTLAAIADITDRAWRLPFVRRVDSLANFQNTYAIGDEMIVEDLVQTPDALTPEAAAAIRDTALARIELADTLIPADGEVTAINIAFILPGADPITEVPSIHAEAVALTEAIERDYPWIDTRMVGSVTINNTFATAPAQDGQTLMGPMFIAILLVVGLALRSALGVAATLLVILLSTLGGLGALGWIGKPLNSVTVLAPLYIMTLGVAAAVHLLAGARQVMVETADRREWARRALEEHMGPIVIASITTAIGFFSLNFSISPPFRDLGNVVGAGVLFAMVYSLTLLPALICFLPIRRREERAAASAIMDPLAEFVIARRKLLLPGCALLALACAFGATQLRFQDDFVRYFDERFELRQDADYAETHLMGVTPMEFPVSSGEADGINDPRFLKAVADFADWARAQPKVRSVTTLTDTIKRLNMNMNADDPAFNRIPDSRDEASQFLFLYELSLGYGMDLTDRLDVNRETLRVTVNLAWSTTVDQRRLAADADAWFRENAPFIDSPRPTGVPQVFSLISERDTPAMLGGTAIALVLISGVILIALRSLKIGLVSLIPNLIPGLMGFGIWGYAVGDVTLAIAVVVAATLGIVVDDTVHFLSAYMKAKRRGLSAEDAVRESFRSVGMALLVTTIGLALGFGILAQSGFAVNGDMAKLTTIMILIALVMDFLLLPALLIAIDERKDDMKIASPSPAMIAAGVLFGAAALLAAGSVYAETPEEKGRAIAEAIDQSDIGWEDQASNGEMVLRDSAGAESRRVFRNILKERRESGKGDLGVIVFEEPRDIRGTGLLTHSNLEPADDDQWLYLPALKRVKRISSSNRTGKFVSSEFSYEDLGSVEVDDYDYLWLRDEPCPADPSLSCSVVESYPKNPRSGYSKRVTWADYAENRIQQVEFHNRRGDLEKRLTFEGYREFAGQYWRPAAMRMENLQTGKSTDLLWTDYEFRTGAPLEDFDAQRLPRMAR